TGTWARTRISRASLGSCPEGRASPDRRMEAAPPSQEARSSDVLATTSLCARPSRAYLECAGTGRGRGSGEHAMNARFFVCALAAVGGLFAAVGGARGGWIYFYNEAAYHDYVQGHPLPLKNLETFEESTLAPAMIAALPGPLLQNGVPNGPFPAGMTSGA